jgi:glutamate--cysteine ligase
LEACQPIAAALDQAHGGFSNNYQHSLQQQQAKVARPQLTPSAKVIAAMATRGSFFKFTMDQAEQVRERLRTTAIDPATLQELEQESAASLVRQAEIEVADTQTFAEFLEDYLALP